MKREQYRIVLIGSGNLATQLSLSLQRRGQELVQVYSRTLEHAQSLANKLHCQATDCIDEVIMDADVYIFSVKDDVLLSLIQQLTSHLTSLASPIMLHTAGSVPLSIFNGYTKDGGVLYPMQTFSKTRDANFREIPCFIEGMSEKSLTVVKTLCNGLSDHVVPCDSERRKYIHLAAVFACNLTNHCYRLCEQVLQEQNIDFGLFLPLINETAKKVSEMSPKEAQTGPMVRYDQTIMKKQMDLITNPLAKDIYALMARSIHDDYQA